MQQLITIPEVVVQDYGPFVGRQTLRLPTSGLCLLKGLVVESGGGSGAGKSLLASTLAFLFGGCPYPATELQSSYADGPPTVEVPLHTPEGVARVKRGADLTVTWGKRALKGKAAAAELDRIFGMDAKMREAVTYRGQDDVAGTFLALSDPDKKRFLTKVLGLDKYERVAAEAAASAKALRERLGQASARAEEAGLTAKAAKERVSTGLVPEDPEALEEQACLLEAAGAQLREEAAVLAKHIESSKDAHWRAYQAAVADLDVKLGELRATAETPEEAEASAALRANDAEIKKLQGRLERVRAYDAEKREAHAQRRAGIQDQLAAERAALRELERLAALVPGLRTQEAALGAATCPTCRQGWHDASCRRALEGVRAQIDKAHLDAFALPVVRDKVAALAAEAAALGDYVPHRAGPGLQAALATARAKDEDELGPALRRAHSAAAEHRALDVQVLETKKRAAKSTAEAAYQTEAAPLAALKADLLARAEDEDRAARDSRDRAARARTTRALIARDQQAARDAAERHRELVEAAAALEREMNRELDLHALVGREGFLGVIFDDVLNEIACAANDILGRVANVSHITFQFDIQREAANESITQAITPVLSLRGRRVDFKSPHVSGGQRAAIRLAIDLAVGEVVAKRRGAYPGWLVLDETFNGLGAVEKESVMEVLDAYAGSRLILVVDHDDRFQGLFQQRIEIEQLDGRSRIV